MKAIRVEDKTLIIRDENIERYFRDIKNTKPLTYEEERELLKLAQQTNDELAKNKLITANLKFVIVVAENYQVKGIDFMDLVSAGNEGLVKAIDNFDLTKEIKFISYAVWWIRNCIIEFLKEYGRTIRLPFNKQEEINTFNKRKEELEQKYQTQLNLEQVFALDEKNLIEDVRQAFICSGPLSSLDLPTSEDSDEVLGSTLGDSSSNFLNFYELEHNKLLINNVLVQLTQTQQQVIKLSFGLEDEICRSNEDIAEHLQLTAERVRQIKNIAMKRLKMITTSNTISNQQTQKEKIMNTTEPQTTQQGETTSYSQDIQNIINNTELNKSNKMRSLYEAGITDITEIAKLTSSHYSFVFSVINKHKNGK